MGCTFYHLGYSDIRYDGACHMAADLESVTACTRIGGKPYPDAWSAEAPRARKMLQAATVIAGRRLSTANATVGGKLCI
jgi:hypothetical protein